MVDKDGKKRCSWCNLKNDLYVRYHDSEWAVPVHDDKKLLEMLILENFQAGLSWECILNKRENFKIAFDDFQIDKICGYNEEKINELLNNPDIIRNKLKIRAAVNNAKIFKNIGMEFGSFSNYIWQWSDNHTIYEVGKTNSKLSDDISKDLKKRGMKFVGSITIYSYLQAIGVIYSHERGCFMEKNKGIDT